MQPSSIDPLKSMSPIAPIGGSRESSNETNTERVSSKPNATTRTQQLEKIRQQIASGSYTVDAGTLAQRILGAHILK